MKQFDTVISNPPYQGNKRLFQKFFNAAVEDQVAERGVVSFLTPATPYFRHQRHPKEEERWLQHVTRFETEVEIMPPETFGAAAHLTTGLSLTTLAKRPGPMAVTYIGGSRYEDVRPEQITPLGLSPKVYTRYQSIFSELCVERGQLVRRRVWDQAPGLAASIKVLDFGLHGEQRYVLIPKKESLVYYPQSEYRCLIQLQDDESIASFISYAKSFVCRFAIGLQAWNQHTCETLDFVPDLPFTETYDDAKLIKLFGLTEDDLKLFQSLIPDFYGLLP